MTKIEALANYLDINVEEITENGNYFDTPEGDFMVLTDYEADRAWEESIDNYIDECILPDLPERYRGYFDIEKFHRDAEYDGRGHSLSPYDGVEHELEGGFFAYQC